MFKISNKNIDLIGDIHGHHTQLIKLLQKLGYTTDGSIIAHPQDRKLAFVGDFINRGPYSEKVLELVKSLCEQGQATAVLGNHEFRLIQNAVSGKPVPNEFAPFLQWLRSLPLFLELDSLRIVHAAWHFSSIALLKENVVSDDSFIKETLIKKSPYSKATQHILSGIKVNIPKDLELFDRFGIRRSKGRLKWWMNLKEKPFSECFFSPMTPVVPDRFPGEIELFELEPYPEHEKPVFIGHYCLPPNIPKVSGQVVCIDGCVTCDHTLWGYQYNGERIPNVSKLIETS